MKRMLVSALALILIFIPLSCKSESTYDKYMSALDKTKDGSSFTFVMEYFMNSTDELPMIITYTGNARIKDNLYELHIQGENNPEISFFLPDADIYSDGEWQYVETVDEKNNITQNDFLKYLLSTGRVIEDADVVSASEEKISDTSYKITLKLESGFRTIEAIMENGYIIKQIETLKLEGGSGNTEIRTESVWEYDAEIEVNIPANLIKLKKE